MCVCVWSHGRCMQLVSRCGKIFTCRSSRSSRHNMASRSRSPNRSLPSHSLDPTISCHGPCLVLALDSDRAARSGSTARWRRWQRTPPRATLGLSCSTFLIRLIFDYTRIFENLILFFLLLILVMNLKIHSLFMQINFVFWLASRKRIENKTKIKSDNFIERANRANFYHTKNEKKLVAKKYSMSCMQSETFFDSLCA